MARKFKKIEPKTKKVKEENIEEVEEYIEDFEDMMNDEDECSCDVIENEDESCSDTIEDDEEIKNEIDIPNDFSFAEDIISPGIDGNEIFVNTCKRILKEKQKTKKIDAKIFIEIVDEIFKYMINESHSTFKVGDIDFECKLNEMTLTEDNHGIVYKTPEFYSGEMKLPTKTIVGKFVGDAFKAISRDEYIELKKK